MAGQDAASNDRLLSPIFPRTRCNLWDKTSVGQPVLLHINHYRKPRVCIPEKIIKLMLHQFEIYGQSKHVLIGTLVVDEDEEGIQIQVDRLDTPKDVPVSSLDLATGNVFICLQVTNSTANGRAASVDDYFHALKRLQSRCCSRENIDLCDFFHLCGWGSFYSNAHTSIVHLDFDMITLETVFKGTPITPVPIVLTALSKNLASPRSLSSLQGSPKTGYLTMDHTRKLRLMLESDPKISVYPIVGIWVSGVELVHHPFVWAACLRYLHNTHLQDRVCVPPEEFLLVLYTPLHSRPEFYQCETSSANTCQGFELSSGREVVNMDKMLTSPENGCFVEVNMEPVCTGNKMEVFDAAKVKLGTYVDVRGGLDDLEPRCAPTPHSEKVPVFHPLVPDVSVLWTEPPENVFCPNLSHGRSTDEPHGLTPNLEVSSRPVFTARADAVQLNLVSPTGELQHDKYHPRSQTQSLLSQHCSPAGPTGQFLPLPISQPPPPVLHAQSGQWLSATVHYTPNLNQATGSNPESLSLHSPSLMPQPTQFTSTLPVGHSSKVSMKDSRSGSDPYDYHPHPGTPTIIHTQNYNLPFQEAGDRCLQEEKHRPRFDAPTSQQPKSRVIQHPSCSQSASSRQSLVSIPGISRNLHSNMRLPTVTALHHIQSSSNSEFFPQRPTLRTITEEISSSLSSSLYRSGQLLEQESMSADILQLNNGELKYKESNGSPFSRASSNNSDRSTGEDSGVGVTPDRLTISAPEHGTASVVPTVSSPLTSMFADAPVATATHPHLDNIKWEQVPPEVHALFIQQSEQLRQLQQKFQILQSQYLAQSMQVSSSHVATSSQKHCSLAINTSSRSDQNNSCHSHKLCDCKSAQVTPAQAMMQQEEFTSSTKTDMSDTVSSSLEGCLHHGSEVVPADGHTVMAVSNKGQLARESLDSFLEDVSQEGLGNAMAGIHQFGQTVKTDVSNLVIDIPEYMPSINDRSQLDENPSSVSDYYRQTEEDLNSTVGEDAADPRLHYSQLMKNIQMFLTNSRSEDSRTSFAAIIQPEPALQVSTSRFGSPANSMIVPEVSSVSMLLGYGSDTCQSMEINALAMKYLSDEQLTHMAKLQQLTLSGSHKSAYSTQILQRVISGHKASASVTSTPDVTHLGISPNDMTLGTQMYLEKHGLLGSGGSILGLPVFDHELQLKTDFSILTSDSGAFKNSFNLITSDCESDHYWNINQPSTQSQHPPLMNPVTSMVPALTLVTADHMNNENWLPDNRRHVDVHKDLGTSPILPTSKNSTKDRMLVGSANRDQHIIHSYSHKRNVLQEVKPQTQVNKKMLPNNSLIENSNDKEEEEEENLLDIEMLKQMPKLL